MTQIAPTNNQSRGNRGDPRAIPSDGDAQAFRDALAQQSLNQLSAALNPSATSSLPGAGVALAEATAAPPTDAASTAAAELVRQDRQQTIRDRGLDAASASQHELRSRTPASADSQPPSASAEPERTASESVEQAASSRPVTEQPSNQSPSNAPRASSGQPGVTQNTAHVPPTASPLALPEAAGAAPMAQPAAAGLAASAARSSAAVQALSRISAASAPTKQNAPTAQPFSIERSAARSDRAADAKPAPAPAQRSDPTAQIQRGLAQVLRQQGGTLTMKLTPHELGEIRIALQIQQSRVTGTIDAQTIAARDLLRSNMDALKASLEQRGVTVDRLEVRLQGAAESDAQARSGAEPRHEHASASADAGGGRHSGSAGGEDRRGGHRGGAPGEPDRSDDRGAAAPVRDDGHGRPDEPAGQWLRLDTTA